MNAQHSHPLTFLDWGIRGGKKTIRVFYPDFACFVNTKQVTRTHTRQEQTHNTQTNTQTNRTAKAQRPLITRRRRHRPQDRLFCKKSSTGHTHTQQQTNHSPLTRHTNTERATAQRQ